MYLNRLAWSCQGLDCLLIPQEWSELLSIQLFAMVIK